MGNIEEIKRELVESLGEEWVHDDPAVMTCYFKDISTIDAPRPNLVVLPATTEDVQKVMVICRKYKIPLIALATGFNVAGLTLPRSGGVVADLKRMNRILSVDTESMTLTMQPYVRNAAAYAEVNRYKAIADVGLRIANPITVGSASYFGNIMSGGMSVNALSAGPYLDHIAAQTWVLSDGSLLNLRSHSNPFAPVLGGYRGPGPDLAGMFYHAEGMFGICTEMAMNAFIDPPGFRFLLLRPKNLLEDGMPSIIDFYYDVTREDFCDELYKSSNITITAMAGLSVEEVAPALPDDIVTVLLTGNDEGELDIKQHRLEGLMEKHNLMYTEKPLLDMLMEIMGTDYETFASKVFRQAYLLSGIMRWQGCFYFIGGVTTMDRIIELKKDFDKLIEDYFEPLNPPNTLKNRLRAFKHLFMRYIDRLLLRMPVEEAIKKLIADLPDMAREFHFFRTSISPGKWRPLYRAHTAIQGPLPMGRTCWLEFDMWYKHNDPEDRKLIRKFTEACADMMIEKNLFIPRDFANALPRQFTRLGTYAEVVRETKRMMDPDRILNPKVLMMEEG